MKLELKHLAPYLPYGLKVIYRVLDWENGNPTTDNVEDRLKDLICELDGHKLDYFMYPKGHRFYKESNKFKPILRPLSDLTNVELISKGFSSHIDFLTIEKKKPLKAPYKMVEYLLSRHFDVFGLIGKGLAIDINTLNK